LAKYDTLGNQLWFKRYDAGYPDYGYSRSLTESYDGGYALLGAYGPTDTNIYLRIIKTDSSGNEKWRKLYYLPNESSDGTCIRQTGDSGYIIAGNKGTWTNAYYIIKTDRYGYANPPIGIEPISQKAPVGFMLFQNFPNPFNPATTIKYDLPKSGNVTIKIYDLLGREVYSFSEYKQAGSYNLKFDGSKYASGLYFYRIEAGTYVETKKMVLIK
jgi:hypothetical protein